MKQTEQLQFANLLDMEVAQLRTFVALLDREEALLVAGDVDALVSLAKDKTDLYHTLQRLHDARALLLGRNGLDSSADSIVRACEGMPAALARWQEVIELARQARERNSVNGKLLIERMQHNQRALAILQSAADRPPLYDAAGNTRPSGGGRILGSA
ncbi:flagella synthesis protein FlgN [Pseudothauera lacus]|nr:flagellar protein FlgN [Pseudothauera lacus]